MSILTTMTFAQTDKETEIYNLDQSLDKIDLKFEDDELIIVDEKNDTTRIKFGNKNIEIIEDGDGGTRITVRKDKEKKEKERHEKSGFEGNWSGIEFGLNNLLNNKFSTNLEPSASFMDLNTNRSINLNINIFQYDIGFGTDKAGLVSGIGLELNNYFFDGNNNITKDENGQIIELIPHFMSSPGSTILRSKLATRYVTVPLLLEFHIPAGRSYAYLSAGLIGGAKIGSNTKIVYKELGNRQKSKVKDDFSLSSIRYGLTFRAGYRELHLFANYYPVPLFEKNRGPELYPFSVGLRLIPF